MEKFIESIKQAVAEQKFVQIKQRGKYAVAYWSVDEVSWFLLAMVEAEPKNVIAALKAANL